MNFVTEYYNFKHKWYLKISSLLCDFYIIKEVNNQVDKIKYQYLEELITSYVNNDIIDDKKIEAKINNIDFSSLNKLEYELLKNVIYVSENYPSVHFKETDYIYYAVILELTILIYNTTFIGLSKRVVYNILKDNLFRFEFIDFKRKQSKFNILFRYLKYINNNNKYFFGNLNNKNIEINITSLSNHRNYFIIDIKNNFMKLIKYDDDLIESVVKNNDYMNKLFTLNFDLLVQQIVFLLEKDKFGIEKVIFNLDKYKYTRSAINYINKYDSIISKYIMFSSSDKKRLDIINNKYSKCIYIDDETNHKITDYKDISILIKNSFWNNHKKNSKKYSGLNFITINDNISYKFIKEEK